MLSFTDSGECLAIARRREIEKYEVAYRSARYGMGQARLEQARASLAHLEFEFDYTSLLDVGCGRGEILEIAKGLGFKKVHGTEVVRDLLCETKVIYAEAHSIPLPDQFFDVVTCFDVLEHLLPEDTEQALYELNRIAKRAIVVTVNNQSSMMDGVEFHVNRRPYTAWERLFRKCWTGKVQRSRGVSFSPMWTCLK